MSDKMLERLIHVCLALCFLLTFGMAIYAKVFYRPEQHDVAYQEASE